MADEQKGDDSVVTPPPEPSQTRTEKEKAEFSLKKNAERLKELGGDPVEALGIKNNIEIDADINDDEPLTYGKLREIQKKEAQATALQMAESITDETERQNVKDFLEKHLKPSGDPQADLARARGAVNAEKITRIAAEQARKGQAVRVAPGNSPGVATDEFVPTEQEAIFMRPPYNTSKEKILAARKAAERQ